MQRSYQIAIGISIAAALWILSGEIFKTEHALELSAAERAVEGDGKSLQRVQVARITAEPWIRTLPVSGRTEAARNVKLRAETTGAVESVVAVKGAKVKHGDALVRLAANDRPARVSEARALVAKRDMEFRAQENLAKKDFTSEVSLANAKAQLESARSMLAMVDLDLARTVIRAPFDGVFNDHQVDVGDYVKAGDQVADIIELDPIKIIADVTEVSVGELKVGNRATATLADGTVVEGPITYVSASAVGTTRTFAVELEVANPTGAIVDGMTAAVALPAREIMAHRVPPSVLTLDEKGTVGIKIVDDTDTVQFVAAQTVSNTADGIWIGGLPTTIRLVAVGQEYVRTGQRVIAVEAPAPQSATPTALGGPAGPTGAM
jgi:multidrug efflux system membrane fusion protein